MTNESANASGKISANAFLDMLNVFVADMRDGVGPYLAIFLVAQSTAWTPSRVGWALASASISSLIFAGPAGWILDSVRQRRLLISISSALIAVFTFFLSHSSEFLAVVALQFATGLASAFIGPGIAALSLELSGSRKLALRIGRNEMFNHAGNFAAAVSAAFLAKSFSISTIFTLVIFMSGLSAITALLIPRRKSTHDPEVVSSEISDQDRKKNSASAPIPTVLTVFKNPQFQAVLLIAFIFQFTNASLLPIEAQRLSKLSLQLGTKFLSWGIVVAQLTAVVAAWSAGRFSKKFSPKLCLAVGLLAVTARALIFAVFSAISNIDLLIIAQLFDGIAAGAIAVAPILAVFDATKASGRFTMSAGALATVIGLGACASQILSGYVAEAFGAGIYFTAIAGIAVSTSIFILLLIMKQSFQTRRSALSI